MHRSARSAIPLIIGLLLACCGLVPAASRADVRLPHVIGSHMVLQRDVPIRIWGWAQPGESVTVALGTQTAKTEADARGTWQVRLPALPAGGPHELAIAGRNRLTLTDVLIGEVWLCSGQSNMEMGITLVEDGKRAAATADHPQLRLFQVPRRPAGQPLADVEAQWRVCAPEAVAAGGWGGFSAVGYFFGRELHQELHVPVGLINSSWGGTPIEPWTPPAGFAEAAALRPIHEDIERANAEYRTTLAAALDPIESWLRATRAALAAGTEPPATPDWPQHPLASERRPTGLYNGMIHPLVPLPIRGAIWYQGEANAVAGDGRLYLDKMKALIGGWRQAWGQDELPFYFVQLAPFRYTQYWPEFKPHQLPELWEAQSAALAIPGTGMVVTTDITDLKDIHPKNKQAVGHRLALCALAGTYGRTDLVWSGPLYRSMSVEGQQIRIRFEHVGGGLASRDGQPLTWFEIAGPDRRFVPASAKIDGDDVLVSSEAVSEPAAVRFGWSMEAEPNLMNKAGLPASPFRTHRW